MRNLRYATIPTTGRACLRQCLDAITPQVDQVILVHAPLEEEFERWWVNDYSTYDVFVPPTERRNISRWWNIGIDHAKRFARIEQAKQWEVAIVNDDAIVPFDWFDRVAGSMRQMGVAAASIGHVSMPVLHTKPGLTGLLERMTGFAFMLAGELGVRADESLEWWFGDDDIDMQSRLKGGTVTIPGTLKHLYPNQSTIGERLAQTAVDAKRFVDKWGFHPWLPITT